jgi:hypothetical protein
MKRALLFLLIVNFSAASGGQTIDADSIFEPKLCGEIYRMRTGTAGEQFYNDDWTESDIRLSSGETVVNKLLMYNALIDEVIWFDTDSMRQVKLEKHFIDGFCFKDYKGRPVLFKRARLMLPHMTDTTDTFVEVLSEDAASLYVFRNIIIQGTVDRVEGGLLYSYDRLVPQPVYILTLPGKETVTFRKIKRSVLMKALPEEHKDAVSEIILQNHLSVTNENDLIKLVSLIN